MKRLKVWFLLIFLIGGVLGSFWLKSRSIWNGQNRINLAIMGSRLMIFSFSPEEKEITFLLIPPQLFLEVIHGYGQYQAEAIYKLGEMEKKNGESFFKETLQENLGILLDGYVSYFGMKDLFFDNFSPQVFLLLLKKGKTNLNEWDLVRLWLATRRIRKDKINRIELEKTGFLEEFSLPDGSRGLRLERERLTGIIEKFFKDEKIRREYFTISVLNITSHPGLANRIALMITNAGGRVVEIGGLEGGEDFKSKDKECEIRGKKDIIKSYTVEKLKRTLNCQWGGEDNLGGRADIVLFVGEGYWKKLMERW